MNYERREYSRRHSGHIEHNGHPVLGVPVVPASVRCRLERVGSVASGI